MLKRQHLAGVRLVVIAAEVKHAVDHRLGQVLCVFGTDDHVAQLTRAGRHAGLVDRKGEHVRGRVDAPMATVKVANLLRRNELDGYMPLPNAGRRKRRFGGRAEQGFLPRDDLDLDQAFFQAERSSGACVSAYDP